MIRWSSSPLFVLQILHLAAQIVSLSLSVNDASFHHREFYDETEYDFAFLQYLFYVYVNTILLLQSHKMYLSV